MMLDFLLVLANLAYFGSPLLFGAVAGLGFGVFSSRISVRRSLLWGLAFGLVGVALTTGILQSYEYWNENLRSGALRAEQLRPLDDFNSSTVRIFASLFGSLDRWDNAASLAFQEGRRKMRPPVAPGGLGLATLSSQKDDDEEYKPKQTVKFLLLMRLTPTEQRWISFESWHFIY